MPLIEGDKGFAAPFSVYTVDQRSWGEEPKAMRFLGCAFPCSGNGILLTCNHVVQEIRDDEILVVQHPAEPNSYKAAVLGQHGKFDIAFLKIAANTPYWPTPILNELSLASGIWAYGYYDSLIDNGKVEVIPQVYTGTITATPRRDFGVPTDLPFYQISFPALPGFSGSPLYFDAEHGALLCGMLFENRSSKVVVRTIDEYRDDKMHFVERSVREWEMGIAHTTMCIKQAATDLQIKIWT